MNLLQNKTGVTQVFYDSGRETHILPNNAVIPKILCNVPDLVPFDRTGFKNLKLGLSRSYALGDVLMLIPIIREMKKQGFENAAISKPNIFAELLGEYADANNEVEVILDGILELDHSKTEFSNKHRIDIYRDVFDLRQNGIAKEWKLDLKVSDKIDAVDLNHSDYIAIQYSGSHDKLKKLNWGTLNDIIKFLIKENKVIVFGDAPKKFPEYSNFINMTGKTNLFGMWKIIRDSKLLICLDSGPLWVSHFESKPTICFLGPTRIKERLSYHPLFGTGKVRGIMLNEIYGCQSCFESMKACGGTAACMNLYSSLVMPIFQKTYQEVCNGEEAK